jgi:hypothetical protein
MKGSYRFIGMAGGMVHGTPFVFKKFGQLFEMDNDLAKGLIQEGLLIIPNEVYLTYGIQETIVFNSPDFIEKRTKIWADLPSIRE